MANAKADQRVSRYIVRPLEGTRDYVVTDRFDNTYYRGARPLAWIHAATTRHNERIER